MFKLEVVVSMAAKSLAFYLFLSTIFSIGHPGRLRLWLWILKDCLESLWLFWPRCVLEKLLEEWNVCFVHPCFLSIQLHVLVKSGEIGDVALSSLGGFCCTPLLMLSCMPDFGWAGGRSCLTSGMVLVFHSGGDVCLY